MSVLIHVIPAFTDLEWRLRALARWCALLLPFAAGGLVASFFRMNVAGITAFGVIAAVLVVAYVVAVIATLVQRAPSPTEAAIARAFLIVVIFLGVAALLGGIVAYAVSRGDARRLQLAPIHATFAIVGWLTMLTMGVSARTLRPMLGSDSRWRPLHIISNSAMLVCAVVVAVGFAIGSAATVTAGFIVGVVAASLYAIDAFDRLRRATTPNRPAHGFVASALTWLVVAAAASAAGNYMLGIVVALAGWLGQMVNGHLHHLGIRVIATTVGGEENETRPWEMLNMRVAYVAVILDQLAVLALALGVSLQSSSLIVCGGVVGLGGMAAFFANVRIAIQRATPGLV